MFRALIDDITRAGGAAGRAYLQSLGHGDRRLAAAVRLGAVARPRRGWYSTWADDDPRMHALRIGGRLTGLAAVAAAGGWVRARPRMHVAVPVNAARLRCPRHRGVRFPASSRRASVTLHWTRARHDRDVSNGIVDLLDALELAFLLEPAEDAIAALDWARRAGVVDEIDLVALRQRLPRSRSRLVDESSADCHSLPESLARTRLRARGLRVREQVLIPEDASPIDLLVEGAVAIEVDGDAFHRDRFHRDRSKDLAITEHGMHAIRPSARHVFDDWPRVLRSALAALTARGIAVPPLAPATPRSSVHNSGLVRRTRRTHRVSPRSSSPRPRANAP